MPWLVAPAETAAAAWKKKRNGEHAAAPISQFFFQMFLTRFIMGFYYKYDLYMVPGNNFKIVSIETGCCIIYNYCF